MAPAPAQCDDSLLLGGLYLGKGGTFAYLSATTPFSGSQLGHGWVRRAWIDHLTYRYEKNAATVKARAYGLEGALGYQGSVPRGWFGVYGGGLYRHTRLSPDDPDSRVDGGKLRLKLQAEGSRDLGASWRASANGSYIFGQSAYWLRTAAKRQIAQRFWTGPELTWQGDRDYAATGLEWALSGFRPFPGAELGITVGGKKNRDQKIEATAGVELAYLF